MADILIKVDETVLPGIAKAIMSKTGKTEPLKITDFAGEIESFEAEKHYSKAEEVEF